MNAIWYLSQGTTNKNQILIPIIWKRWFKLHYVCLNYCSCYGELCLTVTLYKCFKGTRSFHNLYDYILTCKPALFETVYMQCFKCAWRVKIQTILSKWRMCRGNTHKNKMARFLCSSFCLRQNMKRDLYIE